MKLSVYHSGFYYLFHSGTNLLSDRKQRTAIPTYPKSASTDRFFFHPSRRASLTYHYNNEGQPPPPPRLVIWLSQTSLPFTSPLTRVFPSLLLRVKSIDRLERNRHAYGQTVKKEGGPGKMTKQTWPCCVKKSPRTIVYLRPLRPLCCQNPDFFPRTGNRTSPD